MTATHKHHRKMRSQGGDDSNENIVELHPLVHHEVHANPALAYEHGLLVHSWDDPADIPVDIEGFLAALGHTPAGTGSESSEEPMQTTVAGEEIPHRHVVQQGVEKPCSKCHGTGKVVEKPKDPEQPQAPERKKTTWSVRVPKDEHENGYEVLEGLIDGTIDLVADAGLIRDRNKGAAYYALVYALAFFQQNFKPEVSE